MTFRRSKCPSLEFVLFACFMTRMHVAALRMNLPRRARVQVGMLGGIEEGHLTRSCRPTQDQETHMHI